MSVEYLTCHTVVQLCQACPHSLHTEMPPVKRQEAWPASRLPGHACSLRACLGSLLIIDLADLKVNVTRQGSKLNQKSFSCSVRWKYKEGTRSLVKSLFYQTEYILSSILFRKEENNSSPDNMFTVHCYTAKWEGTSQ